MWEGWAKAGRTRTVRTRQRRTPSPSAPHPPMARVPPEPRLRATSAHPVPRANPTHPPSSAPPSTTTHDQPKPNAATALPNIERGAPSATAPATTARRKTTLPNARTTLAFAPGPSLSLTQPVWPRGAHKTRSRLAWSGRKAERRVLKFENSKFKIQTLGKSLLPREHETVIVKIIAPAHRSAMSRPKRSKESIERERVDKQWIKVKRDSMTDFRRQ